MSAPEGGSVVALCGGVGGAKLALGLYRVLAPERLTVVVNTGDDFEHLGLYIAPDIDTVLYTLAGSANPDTGWGRAGETWSFMAALARLGGETWFQLGDGDLALHVERTRRLAEGQSLSRVTEAFRRRLGITARILPMSDRPVRTLVETADGPLEFQDYFVRRGCAPRVAGVRYAGAEEARAPAEVARALADPGLRAVVLCPSNPYLSLGPMLAVPGLKEHVTTSRVPVVAVSPLVGGRALKGPTAKIMAELGVPARAAAIARFYRGVIDALVLDRADQAEAAALDLPCLVTETRMTDLDARERLAAEVLAFADRLAADARGSARAGAVP